jgi:hypothetical protein
MFFQILLRILPSMFVIMFTIYDSDGYYNSSSNMVNPKNNLLKFPVLQMMEHCKMNCGADSRKASKVVELNVSF